MENCGSDFPKLAQAMSARMLQAPRLHEVVVSLQALAFCASHGVTWVKGCGVCEAEWESAACVVAELGSAAFDGPWSLTLTAFFGGLETMTSPSSCMPCCLDL